MKFGHMQPGDVVYSVGRQRMGNTTMTREAVWPVRVVEMDSEKQLVKASWNGNAARWFPEHQWRKWRLKRPQTKVGVVG